MIVSPALAIQPPIGQILSLGSPIGGGKRRPSSPLRRIQMSSGGSFAATALTSCGTRSAHTPVGCTFSGPQAFAIWLTRRMAPRHHAWAKAFVHH